MRARSLLAVAAVLLLILAPALEASAAKRGGGSFSGGGSRSGSSGWSSSTRPSQPSAPSSGSASGWSSGTSKPSQPATTPSAQGAPAQSQGAGPGWSNSTGAASSQASRPAGTSAFSSSGADAAKRQAATTSYQGYQGLYSKPGNPVSPGQVGTSKPILNQSRTFGSYQDYNRYRDNYYSGRGWSAPGYAYRSFSGFGMWDAMFMWFMLSNLTSGAGFFHNHQADPGVQAFKQEAAKLAESNADLKKQLDDMNAKLDQMKKDGVPVDPSAMPKDVDPDIALAQPKIEEQGGSSSSLLGPVAAVVLLGGAAYLFFNRRRHA